MHWETVARLAPRGRHEALASSEARDLAACKAALKGRGEVGDDLLVLYERDLASFLAVPREIGCKFADIREATEPASSASLDFCAFLCADTRDCIDRVAKRIVAGGVLSVTLMRGREIPGSYEAGLIDANRELGSGAARMMAVYAILPHTTVEWFRPVRLVEYVGRTAPMCQMTFRRERMKNRAQRVRRVVETLQRAERL